MQGLIQLISVLVNWTKTVPGSRKRIAFVVFAGAIAGFGSTVLIWVINATLSGNVSRRTISAFVLLCLVIPAAGFIAQTSLFRLTAHATEGLRLQISRQILAAPYRSLEEMGIHKITGVITEDVPAVITALVNMPLMFTHTSVIFGCLGYLGYLSWPLLVCMLAYMVVGLACYQFLLSRSVRYFRGVREHWDAFFKGIQALTHGNKELKLHSERRSDFLGQELGPSIRNIREFGIRANTYTAAAVNIAQILFFIFIGLTIFVTPFLLHVPRQAMIGYTITILFMITPLTIILNLSASFGQALVAAEKVRSLGLSLAGLEVENIEPSAPAPAWRRLELINVAHVYHHETEGDNFRLGPINLSFSPGEVVFLIGGNGSGKTTLAKLLVGLYEPEEGEIHFDNASITHATRDFYRQHFSAIFSDFYLFEQLFGLAGPDLEKRAEQYLASLQLAHKVRLQEGKLSTIELSQGQRKRLALLVAYLENRPIYLFDEWASDQDPVFKEVFYHRIIPNLKAAGKTVIVISHDDRYYSVADRLIKLDSGQIEYDRRVTPNVGLAREASSTVA
ncbi:MAG: cyclic peptide export ABC transporter [Candidatus Angelobacter sp.]